jgi:hypothetical protein
MSDGTEPFIVLDFLRTFYTPFVWAEERKRLLKACLAQLDRLAKDSSGVVSIHPPSVLSNMENELLKIVTKAAKDTYHVEMADPRPVAVRVT